VFLFLAYATNAQTNSTYTRIACCAHSIFPLSHTLSLSVYLLQTHTNSYTHTLIHDLHVQKDEISHHTQKSRSPSPSHSLSPSPPLSLSIAHTHTSTHSLSLSLIHTHTPRTGGWNSMRRSVNLPSGRYSQELARYPIYYIK